MAGYKVRPCNCDRRVDIIVKFCKLIDVFPDSLVRGMEDMRTVNMYVDTVYFLGINVTRDVIALYR